MGKNKDPKKLWNFARSNIRRAVHSGGHHLVDTVRVDLKADEYLGEIGVNKMWKDSSQKEYYNVKKLSLQELRKRELIFDPTISKMFVNGRIADTGNFISKRKKGIAAFVMDKEGHLYIEEHKIRDQEALFHGSFLDDRPAEMAGMITLKDGKITMISDNSGHYKPDRLDMYRGIKKLYSSTPEAFDINATIEIFDLGEYSIKDFIQKMETNIKGVPYHIIMRNERIKKIEQYKNQLQSIYFLDDVKNNRLEKVRDRLEQNPNIDINQTDQIGNSALAMAIGNGNQELEKYLREKGANNLGKNSIQYALEKGNIDAIGKFERMGVDLNESNYFGQNAMHIAAKLNKPEYIKMLNDKGVGAYYDNSEYRKSPLDYAAENNNVAALEALIKLGMPLEKTYEFGAMHFAAQNDALDSIQKLNELGVDVNNENLNGVTPLHCAAEKSSNKAIAKLCSLGAEINSKDFRNETPFHYAAKKLLPSTLEELKSNGADVNAKNEAGDNALHLIFMQPDNLLFRQLNKNDDELKTINKLIELGVNLDEQNQEGKTPLHYLVEDRPQDLYLVEKFIEAKANLNIKDSKECAPLHYAAYSSSYDNSAKLFAKLLEGKPDLNLVDKRNKNPIQILNKDEMNKVGNYVYELNKDNPEKITQIMNHIIKSGAGTIQDKKENWDLIETIINKIPENERLGIVNECIKSTNNKSRKNKLYSFLGLSDQKKLKGEVLMQSVNSSSSNSLYSKFFGSQKNKSKTIGH